MKPQDIKELRRISSFLSGKRNFDNEFSAVENIIKQIESIKKDDKIDLKSLESQEIVDAINNLGRQDIGRLIFLLILDKI